ncbi:MAG: polysaccharide deacetylase family protein [Terracidiphilus sp.]
MRQAIVKLIKTVSARFPRQFPLIWSVRQHEGRVAITFDDGPTGITPQVLECLARHRAKATFFVLVSKVTHRPDLLRQILAHGHEVGIHSYEHSLRDYLRQVQRAERELAAYGVVPSIVRTPGGVIKSALTIRLWLRGYLNVLWSLDTHDSMRLEGKWSGPAPDYSSIKGGDIVLMHDDNSQCVLELPSLLESIRERNLRTVTVSELIRSRS